MRVRIPSGSPVAAARSLAAMRLLKAIFPAMSKEATVARLEASAVWMYRARHVRSQFKYRERGCLSYRPAQVQNMIFGTLGKTNCILCCIDQLIAGDPQLLIATCIIVIARFRKTWNRFWFLFEHAGYVGCPGRDGSCKTFEIRHGESIWHLEYPTNDENQLCREDVVFNLFLSIG